MKECALLCQDLHVVVMGGRGLDGGTILEFWIAWHGQQQAQVARQMHTNRI